MKTLKIIILFCAVGLFPYEGTSQQILNGGFEEIHFPLETHPELPRPMHWGLGWGADPCDIPLGELTSDTNTGNWAVRLETSSYCQGVVLASGAMNLFSTSQFLVPVLGHPLNARPDQASFYYRYTPVNGDTAFFSILMYSLPDTLSYLDVPWYYSDTISYMQGFISEEVLEYEQKVVDLEYESESTPQYIEFRFLSTKHGIYSDLLEIGQGHTGTTLWVDDIELIYLTTSSENLLQETEVRIYPNPVADHFQVEVPANITVQSIQVHDFSGRHVKTLNPQNQFFSLNELPAGMYFLTVHTNQGSVVKKLVKE